MSGFKLTLMNCTQRELTVELVHEKLVQETAKSLKNNGLIRPFKELYGHLNTSCVSLSNYEIFLTMQ